MKVTFFSVVMGLLWTSALMLLFSALMKKQKLIDVCSISGVAILYVFCAVRMLFPVEFSWVIVIPAKDVLNPIYTLVRLNTPIIGIAIWKLLIYTWIAGSVVLLIRLAYRYWSSNKKISVLCQSAEKIDVCLGVNVTSINKYISENIKVPVCVGVFDKKIIIPRMDYSDKELEMVIRHEYIHIQNGDLIVQLLVNLLCVLYWWNPLVYLFRKDIEFYFELRCDRETTKGMTEKEAADYLETLLNIYKGTTVESLNSQGPGVIEIGIVDGRLLQERFEYLRRTFSRKGSVFSGRVVASIVSVLLLIVSYSFIFQSAYEAPNMEDGEKIEYIDPGNAYLVRKASGEYVLVSESGLQKIINQEHAETMIRDGFEVHENGE